MYEEKAYYCYPDDSSEDPKHIVKLQTPELTQHNGAAVTQTCI
jgi:hypothetical protein